MDGKTARAWYSKEAPQLGSGLDKRLAALGFIPTAGKRRRKAHSSSTIGAAPSVTASPTSGYANTPSADRIARLKPLE